MMARNKLGLDHGRPLFQLSIAQKNIFQPFLHFSTLNSTNKKCQHLQREALLLSERDAKVLQTLLEKWLTLFSILLSSNIISIFIYTLKFHFRKLSRKKCLKQSNSMQLFQYRENDVRICFLFKEKSKRLKQFSRKVTIPSWLFHFSLQSRREMSTDIQVSSLTELESWYNNKIAQNLHKHFQYWQ